ncbi:MAG: hypothetical protein R3F59_16575 [Myxococcota bacterium]
MKMALMAALLVAGECTDPCPTQGDCPPGGTTGGGSTGGGDPNDTDPGPGGSSGTDGAPYDGTIDHFDAAGSGESARGTVWVTSDRTGDAITDLSLPVPVRLTIDDLGSSLASGYPVGTTLEITDIDLGEPVALDRTGYGRVAAGLPVTVDVTVTEPRAASVRETVQARLPWDLEVSVARGRVSIPTWSDGDGGTFEVR